MIYARARSRGREKGETFFHKTTRVLGGKAFFSVVIALFVVQAGWIAISSQFPQAFDEAYHFGIIQTYSQQWSPFIQYQAPETYALGDIVRYPSYLFHYLLSFPYRVMDAFSVSNDTIIITLRFINIAFVAAALVVFRHVLLAIRNTKALVHTVLLIFAMLPVMPYLAAHINYDNLVLLWTGLLLLYAFRFISELKGTNVINTKLLIQFLCVGCLGGITKYSFLPILAAVTVGIMIIVFKWSRDTKKSLIKSARVNFTGLKLASKITLISALVIFGGLFVERYAYNIIMYKDPAPQCNQVLSIEACSAYSPWQRNYTIAQAHTPYVNTNQIYTFGRVWISLSSQGIFAIYDASKEGVAVYSINWLRIGAAFMGAFGMLLFLLHWRSGIRNNYAVLLSLGAAGVYVLTLIAQNYTDFTQFGLPIAIQGRYLLPILPVVIMLIGIGYSYALKDYKTHKSTLAVALLGSMILYGGASTYILRTDSNWYWDQQAIISANSSIRDVLAKIPGN